MISNEVIDSFLKCNYKSYLQFNKHIGCKTEYEQLESELRERYKNQFYQKLRSNPQNQILSLDESQKTIPKEKNAFVISPTWQSNQFQISFDALELIPDNSSSEKFTYIPILISPREKVSKLEKLSFVIKCLILKDHGISPEFGKIIYGRNLKSTKIKISSYLQEARKKLKELINTVNSSEAPRFFQNKYCKTCEFQDACKTKLIEADDLSLLGNISKKEVLKKNNRGIFSIYQLSYTFRPRKKSKKKKALPKSQRFLWELKALALREKRTYIREIPQLPESKTEIYLDFEGLPDEGFVYLIGMVIKKDESEECFSFWANSQAEEENIFKQLFDTLLELGDYTVYHYGSYEIRALNRISTHLDDSYKAEVNRIINNSINLLSIFTSIVYPSTYTNGLKDIAGFLGFQWSDKKASGLQSIVWRKKWELFHDNRTKEDLILYNKEDCLAVKVVAKWLKKISSKINCLDNNAFFDANEVEVTNRPKWGDTNYKIFDFEKINRLAYFDYQRNKIYVRTNKRLRKIIKRSQKIRLNKSLKIDKKIKDYPDTCPACNKKEFLLKEKKVKLLIDLKFIRGGIKRCIEQVESGIFQCQNCEKHFTSEKYSELLKHHYSFKYGHNLMIWCMYEYVVHLNSYAKISKTLSDYYELDISLWSIPNFKEIIAHEYMTTYEELKKHLINGEIICADETKINILDSQSSAYVWVFTSMTTVIYLLKRTRKGDFLKEFLRTFNGILVSDFYSAYDSPNCLQQKCLVHLIRDLNNDLLKNQFDTDFQSFVIEFGKLLRKIIIETIDKYGLKKRHLGKHKNDVNKFFNDFVNKESKSEFIEKYQKRFKKYREKLFLFLDYDGIPWNNNNAEHAIKPFAKYRRNVDGKLTEKTLSEYLVLLSIQQTCEYRGISFWDFLKSGQKSIEEYCRKH